MSTSTALEILEIERNELAHIAGVENLTIGDLSHLLRLCLPILEGATEGDRFLRWLVDVMHKRIKSLTGDKLVEPGKTLLRLDTYSLDEVGEIARRMVLVSGFHTLSIQERDFVNSIIQKAIIELGCRANVASINGVAMMSRIEVADMLGVNPAQITALVRQGAIPKPVRLGKKTFRWHSKDVMRAIGAVK